MDKPFVIVIVICVIMAPREKKSHDTEIMGKIENNSLHK